MPGFEKDISQSFHILTSYILERIDHEDKYTVATAYELYRQTMNDNYSLRNILSSIAKEESKVEYSKPEEIEPEIETINQDKKEVENTLELKSKSIKKLPKSKKTLFMLGGLVIVSALTLLIYFLYRNRLVLKSIEISKDILIKSGGILLIVIVIVIYSIYKNAQLKKEEESDSLIVVEDNKEFTPKLEKEKKENYIEPVTMIHQVELQNESRKQDLEASYYGNTVLLNYRVSNKRLISTKETFQSFDLKDKTFLIGKMQEHVDGVVLDERISRIHAEIKKIDSNYFLTDLNSTNGTFHNGRRLEANETVEIHPEDMIRFATVEYVFR